MKGLTSLILMKINTGMRVFHKSKAEFFLHIPIQDIKWSSLIFHHPAGIASLVVDQKWNNNHTRTAASYYYYFFKLY